MASAPARSPDVAAERLILFFCELIEVRKVTPPRQEDHYNVHAIGPKGNLATTITVHAVFLIQSISRRNGTTLKTGMPVRSSINAAPSTNTVASPRNLLSFAEYPAACGGELH